MNELTGFQKYEQHSKEYIENMEEKIKGSEKLLNSMPIKTKTLKVKIKRLPKFPTDWKLPAYGTEHSACFDLQAIVDLHDAETRMIGPGTPTVFGTGLAFEIPEGYAMFIYSRSGMGFKHGVRLVNSTGCIDSDYRDEIKISLHNDHNQPYFVKHGDRIAQAVIVPVPKVEWEEVEELSDTDRGLGGFGSTGK